MEEWRGLSLKLGTAILCLASGCYFAWMITPSALGVRTPTVEQGLFPEWLGAHEVLHGRDPYAPDVTQRIQSTIYRAKAHEGYPNEQRFAYPVYSTLLFLPLAVLPFSAAQDLALAICLALTVLSVWLWLPANDRRPSMLVVTAVCLLSTCPALLGLQLRQPSLVIAGLLSVVVYWAKSGQLVRAAMLAALCSSKPQLAVAVLLPLLLWSAVRWHERKRFPIALGVSLSALLLASEGMVPGWFSQWLTTLRAYSHYAGTQPPLADLVGGHCVWLAGALLIGASLWVSHRFCESDLLFAISFSVAVFQLLFNFLLYNEILLLPAAIWLLRSGRAARPSNQLFELLLVSSWVLLASGAVAMFGLSAANLFAPGSGLILWQIPFLTTWLYPWSVVLALGVYAFSPVRLCMSDQA